MRGGKRGQAAMEFLMTYGWALFIFLGMMGAMVYLDVFNFDQFVTEKCDFTSGVYCIDGVLNDQDLQLVIQNGMVIDMVQISVHIPDCSDDAATGPLTLLSGEDSIYNLTCSKSLDQYLKGPIYLNYTNSDSGLDHRKIGSLLYRTN